jgi:hypothetical protein
MRERCSSRSCRRRYPQVKKLLQYGISILFLAVFGFGCIVMGIKGLVIGQAAGVGRRAAPVMWTANPGLFVALTLGWLAFGAALMWLAWKFQGEGFEAWDKRGQEADERRQARRSSNRFVGIKIAVAVIMVAGMAYASVGLTAVIGKGLTILLFGIVCILALVAVFVDTESKRFAQAKVAIAITYLAYLAWSFLHMPTWRW